MTPPASPYAVFRSEEWVSGVAQPIGIGQCLRLTPKKLVPIRSSIKKKSDNSLRKGFSKKHVQLSFAWHVNISIIPAKKKLQNDSFVLCSSSSYSSWGSFDFRLSTLDAAKRERLVGVQSNLTLGIDQFGYKSS